MSEKAAKLQTVLQDAQVVMSMDCTHPVKLADGDVRSMQSKRCLVRTALHARWGPVMLDPSHYAVMPGEDDMVIIGTARWRR